MLNERVINDRCLNGKEDDGESLAQCSLAARRCGLIEGVFPPLIHAETSFRR